MQSFILAIFLFSALTAFPQQRVDVNSGVAPNSFYMAGGSLVSNVKYVKVVEGSPYFKDGWMRGSVIMSKGIRHDSILLRLDLLDHSLQYQDPQGKEFIATSPVKAILLTDSVTGKKYEFDNSEFLAVTNKIEKGWYQLLSDGQAAFYKRTVKMLNENQPYGSATVEQTIAEATQYYIFVNSTFTRIKKLKDVADLLRDKKDELIKYISSKNLSGRTDTDYSGLVDYYNSLLEK
jgi:hypothetical protein